MAVEVSVSGLFTATNSDHSSSVDADGFALAQRFHREIFYVPRWIGPLLAEYRQPNST